MAKSFSIQYLALAVLALLAAAATVQARPAWFGGGGGKGEATATVSPQDTFTINSEDLSPRARAEIYEHQRRRQAAEERAAKNAKGSPAKTPMTTTTTTTTAGTAPSGSLGAAINDSAATLSESFADAGSRFRTEFHKINVPAGVMGGIAIAFGIFLAFAGYKFYRLVLFVAGAALGGMVSFLILAHLTQNGQGVSFSTNLPEWAPFVIVSVSALVFGTVSATLATIGIFLMGAFGGAMASLVAIGGAMHDGHTMPQLAAIGLVVGVALVFGIVTLWQRRVLIAVVTALGGSVLAFVGADVFVRSGLLQTLMLMLQKQHNGAHSAQWRNLQHQAPTVLPMAAGMAALFTIGTAVQLIGSRHRGSAWSVVQKNPYAQSLPHTMYY